MISIKKYLPFIFRANFYFLGVESKIEVYDTSNPFFAVEKDGIELYRGKSFPECENYCVENGLEVEK